jgi:hypothetical protein
MNHLNTFYVRTDQSVAILKGDYMTIADDTLFIYKGDELIGMFKTSAIIDAHKTEGKT